jgi:TPR repeat protein
LKPVPSADASTSADEDEADSLLLAERDGGDPQLRDLAQGCLDAVAASCEQLAIRYFETEPKRAIHYYERACNLGSEDGCYGLAYQLDRRDDPRVYSRVDQLLQRACDANVTNACGLLGLQLYWGKKGHERDLMKAAPLFRKACAAGETGVSCLNLGLMIAKEQIPGDQAEALSLFRKSCDGGEALGCYDAGLLALDGVGGTRPRSCSNGDATCTRRTAASTPSS